MAAEIQGIEFEIKGSTNGASKAVDSLKDSLKKLGSELGKVGKDISNTSGNIKQTGTATKKTAENVEKATTRFQKLMAATKKVGTVANTATTALKKLGSTAAKAVYNIGAMPFKYAAEKAGSFISKLDGLISRFKRILFMRVVRNIIRQIGDAFKYGVNNLYEWNRQFGNGEFAASMDSIATSFTYFKNSIGAAVAPLINALAPAIEWVADKAVALLNIFNQLFARLTGQTYWTKATRQATTYGDAIGDTIADSADDAKESIAELLRYMAPFDELNVLPSTSDSGNSGNGSSGDSNGSGGGVSGGLFEEKVDFDQDITDFADRLKEAFENADFTEIGDELAHKLADALDNIPWDTIQEKAEKIGKSIGTFITGFVQDESVGNSIGVAIGEALNTAIDCLDGLYESIKFDEVGEFVAAGVMGAINTFDFEQAGKTLDEFVNGVLTAIVTATDSSNLDWTQVGSKIADFISKIKWGDIFKNTVNIADNVFNGLLTALVEATSTLNQDGTFTDLGVKIGEALRDFDWKSAWEGITGLGSNILEALTSIIVLAVASGLDLEVPLNSITLTSEDGKHWWDPYRSPIDWLMTAITGVSDQDMEDAINDLLSRLDEALGNALKADPSTFTTSAKGAYDALFSTDSLNEKLEDIADIISTFFTTFATTFKEKWTESGFNFFDFLMNPVGTIDDMCQIFADSVVEGVNAAAEKAESVKIKVEPVLVNSSGDEITANSLVTNPSDYLEIPALARIEGTDYSNLTDGQKTADGITAKFGSTTYDFLSTDQKTTNTTANFSDRTWNLTDAQKTTDVTVVPKITEDYPTFADYYEGHQKIGVVGMGTRPYVTNASKTKQYTSVGQYFTSNYQVGNVGLATFPQIMAGDTKYSSIGAYLKQEGGVGTSFLPTTPFLQYVGKQYGDVSSCFALNDEVGSVSLTVGLTKKWSSDTIAGAFQVGTASVSAKVSFNDYDKDKNGYIDFLAGTSERKATAKAYFNEYESYSQTGCLSSKPWAYGKAYFNEYESYSGYGCFSSKPWAYGKAYFNEYESYSGYGCFSSKPWAYGKAYFNEYESHSGVGCLSSKPWVYGKVYFDDYASYSNGCLGSKPWAYAKAYFNEAYIYQSGTWVNMAKAIGGVFDGSGWHDITQYAGGGLPNMGQMFIARERGPELVGTLKGHTAVMNNDQIVASVSAGVARAISSVEFHMQGLSSYMYGDGTSVTIDEEAIYRAMRRALDETDFGNDINIDGEPLYNSVVRRNRKNTKMTGVNAMMTM